jgi:Zn-dependent M28 family amino/carboxypeptidase
MTHRAAGIGRWSGAAAGLLWSAATLASQSVAIDGPQLLKDLAVLAADDMQGREAGSAGGARARAYIEERFKASGLRPVGASYLQEFPLPIADGSTRTGVNVVGRLDGRGRADRFIVVSAHYDHVGIREGRIFNGANDNASGTAALFALARYFGAHPTRHSLLFAAFDAEEMGLVGARAFVRRPPVDRSAIVLNLNADMVGRDADNLLWVSGTFDQPHLKAPVARVAARAPVTLRMGYDDPAARPPRDYWMRDSDQWAFREAGIAALYIGVEDREHHHRHTDDYANMTHDYFVKAVETIGMLIEEFDRTLE